MLYRGVEIVDGETEEPVNYVGIHPIRWPTAEGRQPTVAFVAIDDDDVFSAGDELAAAVEDLAPYFDDRDFTFPGNTEPRLKAALKQWYNAMGKKE
jgi:hypothetical protein